MQNNRIGVLVVVMIIAAGAFYIFEMSGAVTPNTESTPVSEMEGQSTSTQTGTENSVQSDQLGEDADVGATTSGVTNQDAAQEAPKDTHSEMAARTYTMTEVAKHDSAESCWVAINGNVYDETAWVSRHPGGEYNILKICGTDGTDEFMGQHNGTGRPMAELASMQIGVLAE